jgi:two-component system, LuxR family, response regulator FixJ
VNGAVAHMNEEQVQRMMTQIDIVDDDREMRDSLSVLLCAAGYTTRSYSSAGSFLKNIDLKTACVITDIYMPEMGGLEMQAELAARGVVLPIIMMTGLGEAALVVRSFQAGAVDFMEKPFTSEMMLASVQRALSIKPFTAGGLDAQEAKHIVSLLTSREREVLYLLVQGSSHKVAALKLGISRRTIEHHRANIMQKMGTKNLCDVVRIALAAADGPVTNARLSNSLSGSA